MKYSWSLCCILRKLSSSRIFFPWPNVCVEPRPHEFRGSEPLVWCFPKSHLFFCFVSRMRLNYRLSARFTGRYSLFLGITHTLLWMFFVQVWLWHSRKLSGALLKCNGMYSYSQILNISLSFALPWVYWSSTQSNPSSLLWRSYHDDGGTLQWCRMTKVPIIALGQTWPQ